MKLLKQIHNEINRDIFGGVLDMPYFICLHDGKHYGWWWDDAEIMNINPAYMPDYKTIFGTVAHEMIHQMQTYENKRLTHGKYFRKLAAEIETFYNLKKGDI